jgi:RNA polymerase sigma-70 factor (ECF subfamily)
LSAAGSAPEKSDADLLAAAARRDQTAFAQLVQRHYKPVYRVAWRLTNGHRDAEDVTQESFLKLWSNPAQVREAGALKGWLMRVASNLVTDRMRRKPMLDLEEAYGVTDGTPQADTVLEGGAARARVDAAVAALPERQKLALTLVYFEQLTNIAAAEVMDVSVDALESLLARARRGLKDKLAGDWQDLLGSLSGERE